MKKNKYYVPRTLVVVVALKVMLAGCNPDGNNVLPDPHAAYYGTWTRPSHTVTISANKLEHFLDDMTIYRLENLTWTAYLNGGATAADYPSGYVIIGTLTNKGKADDVGPDALPLKPDTAEHAEINELAVDYWYIHRDGQSLVWGSWHSGDHFGLEDLSYSYIKQQ
jgi:hypothetical protein